ncbi:hypothetical protein ACWGLF_37170, partial [Streptomyces puniciscabiei]
VVRDEINTHRHTLPTKITKRKIAAQVILKRSVTAVDDTSGVGVVPGGEAGGLGAGRGWG